MAQTGGANMSTAGEGHKLEISNVEVVASYNWLDIKEPRIVVPGKN